MRDKLLLIHCDLAMAGVKSFNLDVPCQLYVILSCVRRTGAPQGPAHSGGCASLLPEGALCSICENTASQLISSLLGSEE